jgi:probable rRNA maturation factor
VSGADIEGPAELLPAAEAAVRATGIEAGHVSIELVSPSRIRELNLRFRGQDEVTDVLAFPVDESGPTAGPRELGDVVICPEHAQDIEEAVVHGLLHLAGYDHVTDDGEMLALQRKVLAELRATTSA